MVKILMSLGIVLLILGSIVEVAIDIGDMNAPRFLPAPLSGLPSSHPATALGVAGIGALVVGLVVEMGALGNPLPGGRLIVGIVAVVAFMFAGGYVFGESEADDSL